MRWSRKGLAIAIALSAGLVYVGFRPVRLAEISFWSDREGSARLSSETVIARMDGNGVAHFRYRVEFAGTASSPLFLEICPPSEPVFHRQGPASIVDGVAFGVGQLGSVDWPLVEDADYLFRVVDSSGSPLGTGRVTARVHALVGVSHWIIVGIGALAAILQILSAIWPVRIVLAPTEDENAAPVVASDEPRVEHEKGNI